MALTVLTLMNAKCQAHAMKIKNVSMLSDHFHVDAMMDTDRLIISEGLPLMGPPTGFNVKI